MFISAKVTGTSSIYIKGWSTFVIWLDEFISNTSNSKPSLILYYRDLQIYYVQIKQSYWYFIDLSILKLVFLLMNSYTGPMNSSDPHSYNIIGTGCTYYVQMSQSGTSSKYMEGYRYSGHYSSNLVFYSK